VKVQNIHFTLGLVKFNSLLIEHINLRYGHALACYAWYNVDRRSRGLCASITFIARARCVTVDRW